MPRLRRLATAAPLHEIKLATTGLGLAPREGRSGAAVRAMAVLRR